MPRRAFTLVELLVVIAIIGLLSMIAVGALGSAGVNSRNLKRKTDMTQIAKALELYYDANDETYPSTGGSNQYRGVCPGPPGSKADSGPTGWIPDLAPAYMPKLPRDPTSGKRSTTNNGCIDSWSCYIYMSTGANYKLIADCTPEGVLSPTDPFYDPARPTNAWQVTNNPGVTRMW